MIAGVLKMCAVKTPQQQLVKLKAPSEVVQSSQLRFHMRDNHGKPRRSGNVDAFSRPLRDKR